MWPWGIETVERHDPEQIHHGLCITQLLAQAPLTRARRPEVFDCAWIVPRLKCGESTYTQPTDVILGYTSSIWNATLDQRGRHRDELRCVCDRLHVPPFVVMVCGADSVGSEQLQDGEQEDSPQERVVVVVWCTSEC